jgi:uncharacterized membrane protein YfcA
VSAAAIHATLFVLLGILTGGFGTLIGAGGGFLLLPILVLLYPGDSPAVLTGISLSVVFANAASGSIAYARLGRIDVRAGLWFALAGLPGSVLGALVTQRLNHRVFDPLLGAVLLLGAVAIVFRSRQARTTAEGTATRVLVERDGTRHAYSPRLGLGAWLSTGVGVLSSLLGIGGGIIHVPLMVYALGFPTHVATATTHFVLACHTFAAVLVHARRGTLGVARSRILPLAAGVMIGAQAGARLSTRTRGRWILWALAAALASVGVRLLLPH